MDDKLSATPTHLQQDELLIVELEERLEFGAALIDSDLNADANSTCTNGVNCSANPNTGCTNASFC